MKQTYGSASHLARCIGRLVGAVVVSFSMRAVSAQSVVSPVDVVVRGLKFPEGAIMVGDVLYFVDYATSDVLKLVHGRTEIVWHQDGCGSNGLVRSADTLLVACYDGNTVAVISPQGKLLETIKQDDRGNGFHAPNDLATDRKGGVYFSASGSSAEPGKLFYRGADRHVHEVASNIQYSNGLVVSLDGNTLYVAESATGQLLTYSIGSDGRLSSREVFVRLSGILDGGGRVKYTPDAVRLDPHGNLYVGLYDGGGFAVIAPSGKLVKQVSLPGPHHASLAVTPDHKFVFVTTSYDDAGRSGEILKVANPLEQ